MQKSVFSPEQEVLQRVLREERKRAGLHQYQLAERLGKPQPFVSRYERGEKLLDLPELRHVCHALNLTLSTFVARYEQALREQGIEP